MLMFPKNICMRKFNDFTDTQLVISFQEGNCEALEALICRYKEKLFSSILFIVKDKYLAEDLFQETFVRIIDTLRSRRYNEEGKFLPCMQYVQQANSKFFCRHRLLQEKHHLPHLHKQASIRSLQL